jgi:hypothetical protein
MRQPAKPLALLFSLVIFGFTTPPSKITQQPVQEKKIQVAILLDVSGSMTGLIEQAKSQLWNMVNILGKAQCADNTILKIELALYEYGRTSASSSGPGYVKQLSSFTNDLDSVSKVLFGLGTTGGDEFCGQVIYNSLDELKWDVSSDNYKVIFIAGNESFLQGNIHYTKACGKAKEKGVIVNTIYCGRYEQGIAEHWNLLGECGNGSYSYINHNASEIEIPTPFDTALITLNTRLNSTYIGYGAMGFANTARQGYVDGLNFKMNNQVAAKRIEAKAKSNVYFNSSWDLVDARIADSSIIPKIKKADLPDSLKNKSAKEIEVIVKQKSDERLAIQKEIAVVSGNRSKYISEQKEKAPQNKVEKTLETEVEKILKEQALRYNLKIE